MMLNMKKGNEQKYNIVHRLLNTTLKFIKDIEDKTKPSVQTFEYGLPQSFIQAVDNVRIQAGYDILPRFRPRSSSRSSHESTLSSSPSPHCSHNGHSATSQIYRSSSTNDLDKITRKVPFRRIPRGRIQQHRPTMNPVVVSSRPRFGMMMNPNMMIANRSRRPQNSFQMQQPMFIPPQQPMLRRRF